MHRWAFYANALHAAGVKHAALAATLLTSYIFFHHALLACRSQLLAVEAHPTFRLRSLQPVTQQQAGLSSPARKPMALADAAAVGAGGGLGGMHLFMGLAQHRQTGKQLAAAVILSAGRLLVSASSILAPETLLDGRQQQPPLVTAVAATGGRCWLGTIGGDLLGWNTNNGSPGAAPAPPDQVQGCSSGGAVVSMCAIPAGKPGGVWQSAAATAGGSCTVLARQ